MILYVVVKTARKDVKEFPGYFTNPHMPTLCIVNEAHGESCTLDKEMAEEVVKLQTEEYGRYFDYKVYELEITE